MNDAAIGLVGMSASMTDAEKAAFRYEALLNQSAFATGAAAEAADTAAGRMNQLQNEVQDLVAGFVEFTGPVGGVVAGLSDASMQMGLAAGGFAELGRGAKAAKGALEGSARAAAIMSKATGLLSTAMGPVGLALAAGVAVTALYHLSQEQERQKKAAREAGEANLELAESIKLMAIEAGAGTQVSADLATIEQGLLALGPAFGESIIAVEEFIGTLGSARDEMIRTSEDGKTEAMDAVAWLEGFDPADPFVAAVQATDAWNAAISETSAEGALLTVEELDAIIQELTTDYNLNTEAAETMGQAHSLIQQIMERAKESGVDTAAVYGQVADAVTEFLETGDATTLLATLTEIDAGIGAVGVTARQTSQRVLDLEKVMVDAWTAAMDPMSGVEDLLTEIFSSLSPYAYEARQAINGVTGAVETLETVVASANGNPLVIASAEDQFYATASAMEILNYELVKAGDNVAAQEQAWANFAARVNDTATALDTATAGIERQNAAIAEQNRIMGLNANVSTQMAFDRTVAEAEHRTAIRNTNTAIAEQNALMLANGASAAAMAPTVSAQIDAEAALQRTNDAFAQQGALMEQNGQAAADWYRQGPGQEQRRTAAINRTNGAIDEQTRLMEQNGQAAADWSQAQFDEDMRKLGEAAWETARSVGLIDDAIEQLVVAFPDNMVINVAFNAQQAGKGLDNAFRVIVGNTNAILDQNRAIMSWADELINVEGVWGRIDALKNSDAITQDEYNAAQQAYNRMAAVQVELEEDILTIQAKQAPVIADMVEAQAEYIAKIAEMEGRTQLAALGFMDSAESAKAMELALFAASAAAGELGPAGIKMAEDIIYGAAMADPVLASMLEQMGLITIDRDGKITVTIEGKEGIRTMQDSVEDLTAAIDYLSEAITGIPRSRTVDIVVNTTYNGTPPPGYAFATGGTVTNAIPKYAMAATGRTTLVGEAGPEMLWLPTGAQVTSAPATKDRIARGRGDGGAVNFYGPVTLAPASGDVAAAIRREALANARGY